MENEKKEAEQKETEQKETEQKEQEQESKNESPEMQAIRELYDEQKKEMEKMSKALNDLQKENAKLIMQSSVSEKSLEENLCRFSKYRGGK